MRHKELIEGFINPTVTSQFKKCCFNRLSSKKRYIIIFRFSKFIIFLASVLLCMSCQMNGIPGPQRSLISIYVRAVRNIGPTATYGINNYINNNNDTITDRATGLMWSQDDNGVGVDWSEALSYAEDSAYDGPAIDPLLSCTSITDEAEISHCIRH